MRNPVEESGPRRRLSVWVWATVSNSLGLGCQWPSDIDNWIWNRRRGGSKFRCLLGALPCLLGFFVVFWGFFAVFLLHGWAELALLGALH